MAKEIEIQSTIIDYLFLKKHFFIRLNNIPPVQRGADGSMRFRRMPKGSMLGLPDIMIIGDGGFTTFLEVKDPKGKLSENQVEFKRRCDEKGAEYRIVKSLDDVIELGF